MFSDGNPSGNDWQCIRFDNTPSKNPVRFSVINSTSDPLDGIIAIVQSSLFSDKTTQKSVSPLSVTPMGKSPLHFGYRTKG